MLVALCDSYVKCATTATDCQQLLWPLSNAVLVIIFKVEIALRRRLYSEAGSVLCCALRVLPSFHPLSAGTKARATPLEKWYCCVVHERPR